jgi:hypothetical protein
VVNNFDFFWPAAAANCLRSRNGEINIILNKWFKPKLGCAGLTPFTNSAVAGVKRDCDQKRACPATVEAPWGRLVQWGTAFEGAAYVSWKSRSID